jgi:hypothetical protein
LFCSWTLCILLEACRVGLASVIRAPYSFTLGCTNSHFGLYLQLGVISILLQLLMWILDTDAPITLAARSKAWTVFARSDAGIVGSNPTRSMDICLLLFCACAVLCVGSGLTTGWSPVQVVLPIVYRIKKLKKRSRSTRAVEP